MRREVASAFEPHAGWLARLRWVGRWEPAAFGLGLAGALLAGLCGAVYLGAQAGALLAGGHLLLLAAVSAGAPRPYCAPLLALTGLSGLHAWLWLLQGLPHGRIIALGYLIAGTLFAGLAGLAAGRSAACWRALAGAKERDDFRWIVTRAPLILRWQVARHFAARADRA